MQTQWSTGGNDVPPVGAEGRIGAGPADRSDSSGPADSAGPADTAEPTDAGAGDADDTGGEEEAHRSAVDAVDGLLDEVERALARLDDGTYGRCEECGTPIDDGRLAASPIVRTCGTCVVGDDDPVTPSSVGAGGLAAATGPRAD